MDINDITYKIRGAIFKVYNQLGPGLLESIYEAALIYQLKKDKLKVQNQVVLDIFYDGIKLPVKYRIDLLVEDKVIIELKSVENILPVHHKQLLTYMKLAKINLGILVNFNTSFLEKNIFRKVLNL